ncbi:MAG: methyltransferase domain-containing protein [Eubacteriales bacterium]
MSSFICPVCGKELNSNGKSLFCQNNHNFDTAKSGYTNLLLSQTVKAKHHGDDKLMVRSRQAFLNKGYFKPLLDLVCDAVKGYAFTGCRILDAGCGECWYTVNIYDYLVNYEITPEMLAVDISKDALSAGAKRNSNIELAVASVFRLPVKENSCDMMLSLFAPFSAEEFSRVLKNDGILMKVFPLEKHLWSLKATVYDSPYENEPEDEMFEGFDLIEKREVREMIHLACNEDIINVFTMTPYYYKTSVEDQRKLQHINELETAIEFGISIYRKS